MPRFGLQLPTTPSTVTPAGLVFARQLALLVGPGQQAPDGSLNAADYLAFGQYVADAKTTNDDCIRNAFVSAAVELLSESENEYGLQENPPLSVAQRQQRLVTKARARFEGTPDAMVTTLLPYDPNAMIYERTSTQAAAAGQPNLVFWFVAVVSVAAYNAHRLDMIADLQQQKPAHTNFAVGTRIGFRTDDPLSLTNRDFLGA